MFSQFLDNVTGKQGYLVFAMLVFLIFFMVVALLLLRMRKKHIEYMSDMPLKDSDEDNFNLLES